MSNSFDSIPASITARALANNFTIEEKARREAASVNKNFYYGNTTDYVTLFSTEVEPITVNYTRPIINKRTSLLYNKKLVRDITGPDASIKALEQVYSDNEIDSLLLKVDLMAELTGSVLVMPELDDTLKGRIRLRCWDGENVSAVSKEDNSEEAESISLVRLTSRLLKGWENGSPQVERIIQQQIWTNEQVVKYDGSVLVTSETNELGYIPFVNFYGEEVYGQYIGFAPAAIVRKLNAIINQKLTDLSYTIKMQAATPVFITGYSSADQIILHPGRAISLPAGATADNLRLWPQIDETLNTIKYLEDKIYDTSSVPKISIVGGETAKSGKELLVRWFPLTQLYKEKSIRWEKYEYNLANMILKVLNLEPIDNINVDYPDEDNLPFSTNDENLDRDIRLGLTSPSKEILKRNADLTEDEALSIFEENIQENSVIKAGPVGQNVMVESNNDSEDVNKKELTSKDVIKLIEKMK
jgi:hypothetical protein